MDDGGAVEVEVEVWCDVVIGDGGAVEIMPSLKKSDGWIEIIKKD